MKLNLTKNLDAIREAACAHVDEQAEVARRQYVTPGAGQAMVYLQKRQEAEAVCANPSIDPAQVPHIAAEAAVYGLTLLDQAAIVLTMSEAWAVASTSIEMKRLTTKDAIRASSSVFEIDRLKQVDWTA